MQDQESLVTSELGAAEPARSIPGPAMTPGLQSEASGRFQGRGKCRQEGEHRFPSWS